MVDWPLVTHLSTTDDPLVRYNELLLGGRAPSIEEFCARFPADPALPARIQALHHLQQDLKRLARSPVEVLQAPPPEIGGYRVVRLLGHGGMGAVYLVEQEHPRRLCALKLLSRQATVAFERFRREADLLARLDHPNVARVYDFGEDGDFGYLATELVHGFSLRDLLSVADKVAGGSGAQWILDALQHLHSGGMRSLSARQPGPVGSMLDLAMQVSRGLAHAHARGVVHRDVKPSNIMVGFDGKAKLIDFGIAVPVDQASMRLTQAGTFVGSCDFAAPEQLRGEADRIGTWTDTYGLGATLYEMLTQRTPFDAPDLAARLAVCHERPAGPRSHNPKIPRAIDRVVLRALDPEPARRYRDGEDFLQALWEARATPWWVPARTSGRLLRSARRTRRSHVLAVVATTIAAVLAGLLWRSNELHRDALRRMSSERTRVARRVLSWAMENNREGLQACLPPVLRWHRPGTSTDAGQQRAGLRAHVVVDAESVREVKLLAVEALSQHTSQCIATALRGLWAPGVGLEEPVSVIIDLGLGQQ